MIYRVAPVGNRNFLEGLAQSSADIVDRDIYRSERSLGVGYEVFDLLGSDTSAIMPTARPPSLMIS